MDKARVIRNRNGEYIGTLRMNTPAICEKCGHEVELFKGDNLAIEKEEILAKCFKCGNNHMATKLYGFWWLYSSGLAWDMMYEELKEQKGERVK